MFSQTPTVAQAQMQLADLLSSCMVVLALFLNFALYRHERYNSPKASERATRVTEIICLILFVLACIPFSAGINLIVHIPIKVTNVVWLDAIIASFFGYTGLVFIAITVFAFVGFVAPLRLRRLLIWMYAMYPVMAGLLTGYELLYPQLATTSWLGGMEPSDISYYFFLPYIIYLIITKRR